MALGPAHADVHRISLLFASGALLAQVMAVDSVGVGQLGRFAELALALGRLQLQGLGAYFASLEHAG